MGKVIIIPDPIIVSISGMGLATELTLNAILLELQLKADLTEMQPVAVQNFPILQSVSVSSLPEIEIKNDSGNPIPVTGTVNANTTGLATEATLSTRLSEADFDDKIGSKTETAPLTDTASSGLNGRLQRIRQGITEWLNKTPTSVGQKSNADSFAVTVSTEQEAILAAVKTSVEIIDDVVDTGRAKVNPIVGQAGVEAGAGTTTSKTQRVVITTDQTSIPVSITDGTAPTWSRTLSLVNAAQSIKASAGDVWGWNLINDGNVTAYVKLYNTASGSVTVGTTTVVKTLMVPAKGTAFFLADRQSIQSFSTAISIACVTGLADSNTTSPGANIVYAEIAYK